MMKYTKMTGIVDGNYQPLCKIALLRDLPGVQYAPDGETPEVDGKIYRLSSQELGESSFTLTCKFKTSSDITTLQFVTGASSPSSTARFSLGIYNNLLYAELQIAAYISRTAVLSANTEYVFSMIADRVNGKLQLFKNGTLISSITDAVKIPPTGNFTTTNKFRVACGGDASDNDTGTFDGDTPPATYLHLYAFSENQIKALHKTLGA